MTRPALIRALRRALDEWRNQRRLYARNQMPAESKDWSEACRAYNAENRLREDLIDDAARRVARLAARLYPPEKRKVAP